MYYTTLNKIRKHRPCKPSWEILLHHLEKTGADEEPLSLEYILDTLGVGDAIWALRAIAGIEREARLFACDCAESVLHIFEEAHPNDMRPRRAIEVARLFALGNATHAAWAAAAAAAWAAAYAADAAAAHAAHAAGDAAGYADAAVYAAARAAARDAAVYAAREKQAELFRKYFCTAETSQP